MASEEKRVKLDQIDIQILEKLQTEGRITNARLAQEVGLSAPPMLERVKKLERNDVITSYRAILNASKVGVDFKVFVAVNMEIGELNNAEIFERQIDDMPEVLECHHIAGSIDFMLKVNVRDQEDFKNFIIGKISTIKGIKNLQSWVVLSTSKETTQIGLEHAHVKRK